MANIKLTVIGMHCHSCEMLIEDSLEDLKGVSKSKASQKSGTVEVSYDEKITTADAIKKVIAKEGFKVK